MSKTVQEAPTGLRGAIMSTYQPSSWFGRNAYAAAIVPTSNGGTDIDAKYLVSLMNEANKVMRDLEKNANDVQAKLKAQYIDAKVAILASNKRLLGALDETAGKDRRQIVESVQKEMSNIRDNMTVLNKVNRQTIDMTLHNAYWNQQQALRAGVEENAANQIAWETAMGDISELGMASEGNPELPTLMATMEKRFGPVEELADNTIKHNAMRLKEVAQQASDQRILMRRRLDGDMGELESIVKDLENSSDLTGDMAKARAAVLTLEQEHGELASMLDPEGIAAQRDLMLQDSNTYRQSKETYDAAKAALMNTSGDEGTRLKMAKLLTSPQFRQWAESNGFKQLGNAEFNDDGTVKWLRPGPRDAFAIHVYASQLQTTPEQPIRFRNTREWARVEINGDALDAKVAGSAYQDLLGDNAYAVMTDPETGEKSYVNADAIDEVLSKGMPARPPGSLVFYISPGNTPYLIEPDTGSVFSAHMKDGQRVWMKVSVKPEDIGLKDLSNPPGKLALQNNGSGAMATAKDVTDKPLDTVALSDDADVKKQQMGMARAALTQAGISLTNDPPKTPTYLRYGKVMPMHASDPPGSIRLRGPNGKEDELIPPEKVANVTITRKKSRTGLLDATYKLKGMRDAELAKGGVGLSPDETVVPNLKDRAVAALTPVEAGQFPEMAVRPGSEGIRREPLETNPLSEVVEGFDAPGYPDTYANPKDAGYISKRKQAEIDMAAAGSTPPVVAFARKHGPDGYGRKVDLHKPGFNPDTTKEAPEAAPAEEDINPRLAPPEPKTATKADMKTLDMDKYAKEAGIDPVTRITPRVRVPSYDEMLVRRGQVDRANRAANTLLKPIDEANAKDSPVSQARTANVTVSKPAPNEPDAAAKKRAMMQAEVEKYMKSKNFSSVGSLP